MKNYIRIRFNKDGSVAYEQIVTEDKIHKLLDVSNGGGFEYKIYLLDVEKLIEVDIEVIIKNR